MNGRTDVMTETRRGPGGPGGRRDGSPGVGARVSARPVRAGRVRGVAPGVRARGGQAPGAPPLALRPATTSTPDDLRRSPGYRVATQQNRRPGAARRGSRTPFAFLVVGLLGGGLLCLLLINTVLATGSFRISALQQGNVTLAQRVKSLQAKVAGEESPYSLARRAYALGMVEPRLLHFLNLATHRVLSEPSRMPGVPAVRGYSP